MESEKVKETLSKEQIIEILKKRIENINPWETHALEYHKGLLDLINELESENERLKHLREVDNKTMTTLRQANNELNECMDEMQDQIAELEKENKILQGTKERLTFADRKKLVDNADEIKLKQFAERLKENLDISVVGYSTEEVVNGVNNTIDETLKEFIGK